MTSKITNNSTKVSSSHSEEIEEIEMTNANPKSKQSDKTVLYPGSPGSSPSRNVQSHGYDERWRKAAIVVSWTSVILSLVFGILLFVFALEDSSSAAFGFALTAILNALTSVVVLWRYYGSSTAYSEHKENKALVALGILFITSGICTGGKTIYSVSAHIRPDFSENSANRLILVSIFATFVMFLLALTQLFVSKKLVSCTLLTDAINSFSSAIMALSLVVSFKVGEYHPDLWYLDEIAGVIIGCFLFIYGILLLARYIQIMRRTGDYEEHS